ncbi:hypothetical protein HMPREF0063_10079 [Aeromicrobium marinum DSM 15272]|uniref:Uncharacterized protein n=1 Tax=Aeromicrobium marinum DSM 15272 TaxID=585531 RepID=E2S7S2_9ACTN|nr:hypothetical protein [Aeromicrobium marinum]EFQ84738.1 hypothetical protein HMPREF0063_10079 [Aeromicrobium marinum DSM 15272]
MSARFRSRSDAFRAARASTNRYGVLLEVTYQAHTLLCWVVRSVRS